MSTKITVTAVMVRGLAHRAAATHGCWTTNRTQLVPATATGRIPAPVGRPSVKPSTQAATTTDTEAGNSIPPASTAARRIAETAATPIMNMQITA